MHPLAPATGVLFENLEKRVLFSQINVADFGALPDDGQDDGAAIQRAIDASQPGDTVNFGAGEFNLGAQLNINSDRQYLGNNTTLKCSNGSTGYAALLNRSRNVTIKGFIFDGAGVKLDGTSGINFTDNTVQNVTSGNAYFGNGVTAMDISNVNVLRNKFLNIGHRGLMVFSVTESRFEDNLFDGCYQAMHFNNFSPSRNVSFSYNTIRGSKRHGIEMQSYGDSDNWLVEGNLIEKWADGRPAWPSHMAISFAMGNTVDVAGGGKKPIRSNGHVLRGNVVIADGAIPTMISQGVPAMYFTAFEVMGNGTIVENNYGEGWGWWQLIGRADANWITRNNTWLGTAQMPVITGVGAEVGREIVPNDWAGGPKVNENNSHGTKKDHHRPEAGARNHDSDNHHAKGDKDKEEKEKKPKKDKDDGGEDASLMVGPLQHATGAVNPAEAASGESVWLSDLAWDRARNGWGPVEIDQSNGERRSNDGSTLQMNGQTYSKGLGVAVDSEISYNLDGAYSQFFSDIGVDDYAAKKKKGSVTFEVWADGRQLFASGTMTHDTDPRSISLDVTHVKKLTLITTDGNDGGHSDHADWAGARLKPASA